MFEDVLQERGAELRRVELDEGEPLPDWREFDAHARRFELAPRQPTLRVDGASEGREAVADR